MSEPAGASHALNAIIWERPNPPIREGEMYTCYMYEPVTGQVKFHAEHCTADEVRNFEQMANNWQLFFRIYPC